MNKSIKNFKLFLLFIFLLIFNTIGHAETILILDAGHDPKFKGAISSCGTPEFELNDNIVHLISKNKEIHTILTRNRNEPPFAIDKNNFNNIESLKSRINISNQYENNAVFISIHHDSVSERYLEFITDLCGEFGGKKINDKFKKQFQIGFNIFVYQENTERYKQSLILAKIIGTKLLAMDQIPSNYHYPTSDDCKSCKPIDLELGIWHQNLLVLRENKIPAILIEVGNLMDPEDFKKITSESYKKKFGSLIIESIKEFNQHERLKN
jgi:N-acetylmuramoyl-L-alanine amidase